MADVVAAEGGAGPQATSEEHAAAAPSPAVPVPVPAAAPAAPVAADTPAAAEIVYEQYRSEADLETIMALIGRELSEPYSIYTYRFFINNWPQLCFSARDGDKCIGTVVCRLAAHKSGQYRGYIAMLAVDHSYRKRRIGTTLVCKAIEEMAKEGADEVVLETEVTNTTAMALYEKLGFVRDKSLFRYYLNGVDAFRLKLWLK